MKIICISGKAGHGKDQTAMFMKEYMEETHPEASKVLITHYADLLKYICKTYFDWDGNKDDYGRDLLQTVGTDVIRKKRPDYWVDFIAEILDFFPDRWDLVIIPDCRFPNEADKLRKFGHDVKLVRIVRNTASEIKYSDSNQEGHKLSNRQKQHSSETALDDAKYDATIFNNGSLNDLKSLAANTLEHLLENEHENLRSGLC